MEDESLDKFLFENEQNSEFRFKTYVFESKQKIKNNYSNN